MAGLSADPPIDRADACGMGAREFDQHDRELRDHRQDGCSDAPDLHHNRVRATAMQLSSSANEERPSRLLHPYVTNATPQELAEALALMAPHTRAKALLQLGSLVAMADSLRETLHEAGLYLFPEAEPEPCPALTMDAAQAIYNAIPFREIAQEAAAKLRERRAAEAGV